MSARAKVMTGQPDVPTGSKRDLGGVHAAHCCIRHWCKYGALDCPVVQGVVHQDHACEACWDEIEDGWPLIVAMNDAYEAGRRAGRMEMAEGRSDQEPDGQGVLPVGVPAEAATAATGVVADLIRAAREWAATPLSMSSRPSKDKLAAAVKACTWIVLPPRVVQVNRRGRS